MESDCFIRPTGLFFVSTIGHLEFETFKFLPHLYSYVLYSVLLHGNKIVQAQNFI